MRQGIKIIELIGTQLPISSLEIEKITYAEKLEKVLDCKQFRKFAKSCDNIVLKNAKELNKEFFDMMKKGRYRLRFTKL